MAKSWKTIMGFSLLGLAIAAVLYVRVQFYDYSKPPDLKDLGLGIASLVVCPPTLLLLICIDCVVTGWSGLIIFSIIGLLNAAIYAGIGAIVVRRRNKIKSIASG